MTRVEKKDEISSQSHKPLGKIVCAFCKGKGKDPFGVMYPEAVCSVCHGMKEHYILKPFVNCAYCKKTGVEPGTRNSCLACHGRGSISSHKSNTKICLRCHGSGMNHETGLSCHDCSGKGVI